MSWSRPATPVAFAALLSLLVVGCSPEVPNAPPPEMEIPKPAGPRKTPQGRKITKPPLTPTKSPTAS